MFDRLFGTKTPSVLIGSAFEDVSTMLHQSERMLDMALEALLDNKPLDVDLDALDDTVDESERMVRRSVLEHLAFKPRQDLVASLILVSMVQDAERIGDFARGIAELVPLAASRREGPFAERLRTAAARLRPLFALCEEGFREDDADKAREVMQVAAAVKIDLMQLNEDVAKSDLTADMAVVYSGAARILRRIGAHLSNIASTVVLPYDRIRHGDEEA
jgi:phosphate uptake regulator